jgi:hypothetical protein
MQLKISLGGEAFAGRFGDGTLCCQERLDGHKRHNGDAK